MSPTYYAPHGGQPGQDQLLTGRAIFTQAYAILPRGVMQDIVTSFLPGWDRTRLWVIARPMTGFAETFSQYIMEVQPGGGSEAPEPEAEAEGVLFVLEGRSQAGARSGQGRTAQVGEEHRADLRVGVGGRQVGPRGVPLAARVDEQLGHAGGEGRPHHHVVLRQHAVEQDGQVVDGEPLVLDEPETGAVLPNHQGVDHFTEGRVGVAGGAGLGDVVLPAGEGGRRKEQGEQSETGHFEPPRSLVHQSAGEGVRRTLEPQ